MASIGDLFFSLRGDPKQLNIDARKGGETAGASFGAQFKKSFSGQNVGKGLVQGLGLAGGLGIASVISKITDVMGDAIAAAREDEASQQRLGSALKANVPAWNGNTAAIEATLSARMRLGFSDDEQRDSLARLVVATKDETKALHVQRVAMDLARLKKISLAEAGDALIKVEAGQFRALKALGIQLPKNATATEALAAVTKAARGQAEDFAKTSEGRLLAAQVKQGEALEKLGYILMPAFTDASVAAADAISSLSTVLDIFNGKLPKTAQETKDATDSATGLLGSLRLLFPAFGILADATDEAARQAPQLSDRWNDAGRSVEGSMGTVETASGDMADSVKDDAKSVEKSWAEMTKELADDAASLIDDAFDPIIARDELVAINAELAAARRVLASKTATKAEIADARATIHSASKDQAEHLLKLAEAGQTGSKAYATGIADLKKNIKNSVGPAKAALQAILDKILEVERVGAVVPINVRVSTKGTSGLGPGGKAAGGPVSAGVPYLVGERGPEIVVPRAAATVLTTAQSMAAISGGGGGVHETNIVQVQGLLPVRTMADIRRERTHLQDARRLRNGLGRR